MLRGGAALRLSMLNSCAETSRQVYAQTDKQTDRKTQARQVNPRFRCSPAPCFSLAVFSSHQQLCFTFSVTNTNTNTKTSTRAHTDTHTYINIQILAYPPLPPPPPPPPRQACIALTGLLALGMEVCTAQ